MNRARIAALVGVLASLGACVGALLHDEACRAIIGQHLPALATTNVIALLSGLGAIVAAFTPAVAGKHAPKATPSTEAPK